MITIHQLHQLFLQAPNVCTDTRKIIPGSIFFALKGESFNGNLFAQKAVSDGCLYAIVDEEEFANNKQIFYVNNVLETLQQLANYHRRYLGIKIIALTGSNGKTTTKELIHSVLKTKYSCVATVGNLNNHIGVPLTILSIDKKNELAIVEMGANHQKEIESLCKITEPDYGIITNIGKAHLEGFGGEQGVLKGKGELYDYIREHHGKIFLNADDQKLRTISKGITAIEYSTKNNTLVHGSILNDDEKLKMEVFVDENKIEINSNLTGAYNVSNILCAVAVGNYFKVDLVHIKKGIENYLPDNNRSQIVNTKKNILIMDAYNANPSSMQAALENLKKIKADKKFFVLGDMRELGDFAEEEHALILKKALATDINGVFIGDEFYKHKFESTKYCFFKNTGDSRNYFQNNSIANHTILIKGSRGIKLETIGDLF